MAVLYILLALIAAFLLVLVVRAVRFVPGAQQAVQGATVQVDGDSITAHMQAMLRCRTVSYTDKALEDDQPFEDFPALLAEMYPKVHSTCTPERIGSRGLLFRWRGKKSDAPSLCMAHYDVVPAEAPLWQKPPFGAMIEGDILWGRGTLDTKCTLLGVMEAAESLIGEGFVPENDLYLAFAGDEEIRGHGAPDIVKTLQARGVHLAFVLDEGGAIVDKVFPGVQKPAALVGISEKGSVNATFHVASKGGHASAPPPHTPVGVLAKAVTKVEGKPFPFTLTPAAAALFDTLGRHSTFVYRLIFANLWCFAPLLNLICKKAGGEMNALVRTTCAFTQMAGSEAPNVLPPTATVGANLRIIGGESCATVQQRLAEVIGDDSVSITMDQGNEPSPTSTWGDAPWKRLESAILQTWPDTIVSPYMMVAASDSTHYTAISEHVYRFCPMPLSAEERRLIHGNDERIPLDKLHNIVRFYIRLMRMC